MFMAMNGMSEAFAYGLANSNVLKKLQSLLVFNSIVYLSCVVYFSQKYGVIGLIYANCINMAVRAVCSLNISLKQLAQDSGKKDGLETNSVYLLSKFFKSVIFHYIFQGLVLVGVLGTCVAMKLLAYLIAKFK